MICLGAQSYLSFYNIANNREYMILIINFEYTNQSFTNIY